MALFELRGPGSPRWLEMHSAGEPNEAEWRLQRLSLRAKSRSLRALSALVHRAEAFFSDLETFGWDV